MSVPLSQALIGQQSFSRAVNSSSRDTRDLSEWFASGDSWEKWCTIY